MDGGYVGAVDEVGFIGIDRFKKYGAGCVNLWWWWWSECENREACTVYMSYRRHDVMPASKDQADILA